MRLHRLRLQAFGPFADQVSVDLDALAADGLFLLHGETGSGKTTLLDAVAFALYGKVPGARGEVKRLRCDRADPAIPTSVTLDLTIGGRRIQITRSPEYQRPKSRGTGMTTQKASVTLRWLDAPPEGRPADGLTRAEEVGQVVLDLLGMSADQFFQVVLLPQGEFARFLRADTAEREVLLEKLFDTGRFGEIEKWFADARHRARVAADDAAGAVDRELARVTEAAGLAQAPEEPDTDWLAALQSDLAGHAERMAAGADLARVARETTAAAWAAGQQRDAAVVKLLGLRAEQAELAAGADAHAVMVAAVDAAERAVPVMLAHTAVEAAMAAETTAVQQVSAAAAVVPDEFHPELGIVGTHEWDIDTGLFSLDEDGSAHVPDPDSLVLRAAAGRVREGAGSLGALIDVASEQDRDVAEHQQEAGALALARQQLAAAEEELRQVPQLRAAAMQKWEAARQQAARLPEAEAKVGSATEILAAVTASALLRSELAEAESARRAAVDAHQSAVGERQSLVERRIAGMAAELAGSLVAGEPCTVCGSCDHPAPAIAADGQVAAAMVTAAQERERQLADARTAAEHAVGRVQAAIDVATAAARGHDEPAAVALLETAETERAAALAAADRLPDTLNVVEELTSREAELAEARTSVLGRIEAGRVAVDRLVSAIAQRATRLTEAAGGFGSVTARRDHLIGVASGLDAWAEAAECAERAAAAVLIALQERDKAVADAGFADLGAALTASALDLPASREAVRRYEERVLVVSTRLADPDLALAGALERVDLSGLRERAEHAAAESDRSTSLAHAARGRCTRVADAASRLQQAWTAHAPLALAAGRMTALAEVVAGRGQNARGLSLRSYVLAAKLQQVAAVAGQRLSRMSGGRYSFVHSDEREARGKSGGLGLDILDAYSGLVRPAKTLSGGESFLASLALALGLADVVAAESGGRLLDTIFIDEGFGSLDSDALDLVMGTLDELRAGGRVVGVVSHVDELRQRIPTRLRVRKAASGSTVEIAGA